MKRSHYRKLLVVIIVFLLCVIPQNAVQAESEKTVTLYGVGPYQSGDHVWTDNAISVDKVVYEYHPDTDTFSAEYADYYNCEIEIGDSLKIHPYILGKPVTAIGYDLLDIPFNAIAELYIPETIKERVYISAQRGGSNLKTIIFPESAPGLHGWTFDGLANLKKVVLPKDAMVTGEFWECLGLKNLTLPSSTRKVCNEAFWKCSKLKQLYLPNGVREIGDYAFWGSRNLELYVPPSVCKIGKNAFGKGTSKIKILYCVKNSVAYRYAKKHNIPYKLVPKKLATREIKDIIPAKKRLNLKVGERYRLTCKVRPFYATGQRLAYQTDSKKIVSVSKEGFVTARKIGEADIIIKAKSGVRVKVGIRVTK